MSLPRFALPKSQPPTVPSPRFLRDVLGLGRTAVVLGAAFLALAACGSTPAASTGSSNACDIALPSACPSPAPSYASDVVPILSDKCVSCHGPSVAQAGIDLTTYAGVFANREPVLAQVYNCSMPLAGSPALSNTQATTLLSWLVCEAPNN